MTLLDFSRRALLASLPLTLIAAAAEPRPESVDVRTVGAKGDGKTDDTAAFQKALDAAGKAGGGVVHAPRGNYFFAGRLSVPNNVTLEGIWTSVPAHNGVRDRGCPGRPTTAPPSSSPPTPATRDGPAFLTLHTNSTLKGVVDLLPEAARATTCPSPIPGPSRCAARTRRCSTSSCSTPTRASTPPHNERHLIRNVQGQPLRMGVWVDSIYDIGRIENVHFNPWWSVQPKLFGWQMANGEAFVFGRSDWQYVLNTFCFGYHVGYQFMRDARRATATATSWASAPTIARRRSWSSRARRSAC